jgi:hypothetical protein
MSESMSEDQAYHEKVMQLAVKVNTFLTEQGESYDVQINALLTVLALAGSVSDLEQEDFCAIIAVQLKGLMSRTGDRPEYIN